MYNETLKVRFLEEQDVRDATRGKMRATFDIIAPYEEECGGDICRLPADQVNYILNNMKHIRYWSTVSMVNHIRRYMKWCCDNGVPGATDVWKNIDVRTFNRMRDVTVASPEQLQEYLDTVFLKEEEETVDITYRCYFWLAYSGVKEEDIYDVKASDLDFDLGYLNYKGHRYELYGSGLKALRMAAEYSYFKYENGMSSDPVRKPRPRVDGTSILRGFRSQRSSLSTRAITSRKVSEAYNTGAAKKRMGYTSTWTSGVFYRTYQRELRGFGVTFDPTAVDILLKTHKFKSDTDMLKRRRNILYGLRVDYDRWKKAWNLEQIYSTHNLNAANPWK